MSKRREVRCYDYVNHPYDRVSSALRQDALSVFRSATKAAAARAQSVAAELHVDIGGVGVKTDINIAVQSVQETIDATSGPTTRLILEWEATTTPRLFPLNEGRACDLPADTDGNAVGFLGDVRTAVRSLGKDSRRNCRPSHRRGVGSSLH